MHVMQKKTINALVLDIVPIGAESIASLAAEFSRDAACCFQKEPFRSFATVEPSQPGSIPLLPDALHQKTQILAVRHRGREMKLLPNDLDGFKPQA